MISGGQHQVRGADDCHEIAARVTGLLTVQQVAQGVGHSARRGADDRQSEMTMEVEPLHRPQGYGLHGRVVGRRLDGNGPP